MTKRRPSGYQKPGDWRTITRRILERDNHQCYRCGHQATSVDHYTPVAEGGSHGDENLGAICPTCKAIKDEHDRIAGLRRHTATRSRRRTSEAHPNGIGAPTPTPGTSAREAV